MATRRVKEATLSLLRERARQSQTITYTELADHLGFNPRGLGDLLDEIAYDEWAQARCVVTALVVRADTGLPGPGFFTTAWQLGVEMYNEEALWQEQNARAMEYLRSRASLE